MIQEMDAKHKPSNMEFGITGLTRKETSPMQ
jgi:hypothetical protein